MMSTSESSSYPLHSSLSRSVEGVAPPVGTNVSPGPSRGNADRKELQYYVNLVSHNLEMTSNNEGDDATTSLHTQDYRLQRAIDVLNEGLQYYPQAYELKFLSHRVAMKEGAISDAVRIFDEIRRKFRDRAEFKDYLVDIARSVTNSRPDENYNLFLRVDLCIRQEILLHSAMHLESKRASTEAFHFYHIALKVWPQLYPQHGAHTASLAVDCEKEKGLSVFNVYREQLATTILPGILKYKLDFYQQNASASHFSHNTYHIPNSETPANTPIYVSPGQIKLWLEYVQGYFIATRGWLPMVEISLTVMQRCNYLNLGSWPSANEIASHLLSEPHSFMSKLALLMEQGVIRKNGNCFMTSFLLGCFVYLCYEFYECVAGLWDIPRKGVRTCLVPVIPMAALAVPRAGSPQGTILSSPASSTPVLSTSIWTFPSNHTQSATGCYSETAHVGQISKKRRADSLMVDDSNSLQSVCNGRQISKSRGIDVMLVKNILNNDDQQHDCPSPDTPKIKAFWESCPSSQKAIICLNQIRQCWQECEDLCQLGADILENELQNLIQTWKIPTYVTNALSIARGELALSSPNVNLQEVERHYKSILQKFQGCKHKRSTAASSISSLVQDMSSETYTAEELPYVEPKTPMMIPFRVLYTSAMLYAMVGWWKEARSDLLIILSAMPFGTITKEHFEQDDEILNNIQFQLDDSKPDCLYQMVEVSREGLAVRTIKELVKSYEQELYSTLSYRQDAVLGDLVILSQYGWPYWRDRLFRSILLPRIKDRGGLKYPEFLRFVHNADILQDISDMYKDQPDSIFELVTMPYDSSSLSASQTQASMKAVAEHATHISSSWNMNEVLIEFLKERCATEPVYNHTCVTNKQDCGENNEEGQNA